MNRLTEKDYEQTVRTEVRPYLDARRRNGFFSSADGKPLFYSVFTPEDPLATAVLVHGFTENIEKYSEVIWTYLQNGYRVCMYEQRGHGRSFHDDGRIHVTDIDDFGRYVDDLQCFLNGVVSRFPGPYVLHAHSMGGGVSALYLIRGSDFFSGAVLNSPMICPYTHRLPAAVCQGIFAVLRLFAPARRMPLEGDYPGHEEFETSCTSSRVRFEFYEHEKRIVPYFQNWCASNRWAYLALGIRKQLLAKGAPEKVRVPVLLFSAGEDRVVQNSMQEAFVKRLPRGEFVTVPGVKHEIYLSPDETVHPYFDQLFAFLSEVT